MGIGGKDREQNKSCDRAEYGAEMIGCPVKAKCKSTLLLRHAFSDQCIARRTADALADAVGHPHDQNLRPARYKCKKRPRYGRQ